jgi:hypothetical protein
MAFAVAVALLALAPPGAEARNRLLPALGDWEGTATNGTPLSFVLARQHRRVVVSDLVIGLPAYCVRPSKLWVAMAFARASYLGPGAPSMVGLFRLGPREVMLEARTPTSALPTTLDGRLISRRAMVLSMPLSGLVVSKCAWPHSLTWRMHPAVRQPVADGTWTGQLGAPGVADGPLTFKVIADGRIVDYFSAQISCVDGGGGSFSAGPGAGEFVRADGSFVGLSGAWYGTFGRDGVLRGTSFDPGACTGSSTVTGPFTATLTAP